ncbi:MAG: glycosyltransferase [Kiritimatiellae bacterium]|nr:glycosyltransferase [Kiritimatiellia bacterium]
MSADIPSSRPLISIITVTRNAARDLPGCLDSVAAQTDVPYEHWVVDGGSTDGTLELLASRNDPRIRWISEPDRGIYDAMNKAVRLARGQWIYFLGSDDRMRADALRSMASFFLKPVDHLLRRRLDDEAQHPLCG